VAATALSVAGAGIALAAAPPAAAATTATTTTRVHKYTGPVEYMRWGPVQVTITVVGKRITNVTATTPTERARSVFINDQALPLLRQEVLRAQSARIDEVSGATLTSDAYDASLQAAIAAAKKAHAL
jgi:uncharacterized protein with FMN-binding domain